MPQTLYYVKMDADVYGPYGVDSVRGFHLLPDIEVLSDQTNEWRQAREYPELRDALDMSLEQAYPAPRTEAAPTPVTSFDQNTEFHIRRGASSYGPYSLTDLVGLRLPDETALSLDGMNTWVWLRDVPGLSTTLSYIAAHPAPSEISENSEPSEPSENSENSEFSEDSDKAPVDPAIIRADLARSLGKIKALKEVYNLNFRRVFPTKEARQEFLIKEYDSIFSRLPEELEDLLQIARILSLNPAAKETVVRTVNEIVADINAHYENEFKRLDIDRTAFSSAVVRQGKTHFSLPSPLEGVSFERMDFVTLLDGRNTLVIYDEPSRAYALDFVSSLLAKLYDHNPPRLVQAAVYDCEEFTGLHDAFKLLDRELYRVCTRTEDVRGLLAKMHDRAGNILRNLLMRRGDTLRSYNSAHENKEPNHVLVFKDFPRGLTPDSLADLWRLAMNGPKVGIYVVLLASEADMAGADERVREAFDMEAFRAGANEFRFRDTASEIEFALSQVSSSPTDGRTEYEILDEEAMRQVMDRVNAASRVTRQNVLGFADYRPDQETWWTARSAAQVEIPFGLTDEMRPGTLRITQEDGRNTALVIGIPGSGKSVFLHSVICSAAMRYSPDELRMYLIDFSGVEFNFYATGGLPHARVIAPEAEREFGLSILNELVEEGARRQEMCREHGVSNIVDLREAAPDIHVPRLLVIIDEFHKFFEIENDAISREAAVKLRTIIKEFRKFGINLILATQQAPSNLWLPRELVANRVVFKCAPDDFEHLIKTENHTQPRLAVGQCIYNSESGAAYDNTRVQGFYVTKRDIDGLLADLREFGLRKGYTAEPTLVFRSAELPEFRQRRVAPGHRDLRRPGQSVPVYLGESIAVSAHDVFLELAPESGNNLLIAGGEAAIAEGIAYNALLSLTNVHEPEDATFVIIDGMRHESAQSQTIAATLAAMPFKMVIPATASEVTEDLRAVRALVEQRRASDEKAFAPVYVGVLAMHNVRAFDRDTSNPRLEKASEAAAALDYVLRNGPAVGVFTVLQTDTPDTLANRLGAQSVITAFNYRVALQMSENDSNRLLGSNAANKLFVYGRPASRFRAYLRDNVRNTTIKFKPYQVK